MIVQCTRSVPFDLKYFPIIYIYIDHANMSCRLASVGFDACFSFDVTFQLDLQNMLSIPRNKSPSYRPTHTSVYIDSMHLPWE